MECLKMRLLLVMIQAALVGLAPPLIHGDFISRENYLIGPERQMVQRGPGATFLVQRPAKEDVYVWKLTRTQLGTRPVPLPVDHNTEWQSRMIAIEWDITVNEEGLERVAQNVDVVWGTRIHTIEDDRTIYQVFLRGDKSNRGYVVGSQGVNRISPNRDSEGLIAVRELPGRDSEWEFTTLSFNLYLDMSVDGGQTWIPSTGPVNWQLMPVPEPSSLVVTLLGLALGGAFVRRSRT